MNAPDINEARKPHFLDEDYVAPVDYINTINTNKKAMNERLLDVPRSIKFGKLRSDMDSLKYIVEKADNISTPNSSDPHNNEVNQDFFSNKSVFNVTATTSETFGPKVKCVYKLLSMLGCYNSVEMCQELLEMSKNLNSCVAMRQSGCISLLVQLMHSDPDENTKQKATLALYNVIKANHDENTRRCETKVFKLLQQINDFCDLLKFQLSQNNAKKVEYIDQKVTDVHPTSALGILTKISFDEEHRRTMCELGVFHAIADMVSLEHTFHGSITQNINCITIRRYAGMILTNLTFGDDRNKTLLCSFKDFLEALVAQLRCSNDELIQSSASVLRNMSWKAEPSSKLALRDAGAVRGLMHAAMIAKTETTLKSILSALWNLSAHCAINKEGIISVKGALGFLVDMLKYKTSNKTLAIIENAGGILRNVSSQIAAREVYREVLRQHNCLMILLQQLKSPSLIIVSNACGTLWNLSARNSIDQQFLWDNGAVPLLRSLIYSKHKMISMGSSAALKNLLNAKPSCISVLYGPSANGLPALPTLGVRKLKSLPNVMDEKLSETCENIEPVNNSAHCSTMMTQMYFNNSVTAETTREFEMPFYGPNYLSHSCNNYLYQQASKSDIYRSESKDSLISTKSDSVYEKALRS